MAPRIVNHYIPEIMEELEESQRMEDNDTAQTLALLDEIQRGLVAEIEILRNQIDEFNEATAQLREELRQFLSGNESQRAKMDEITTGVQKTDQN